VVEKDGYISETVMLTSGVGSAVVGNIILGGLIGGGIDMATGAAYKLYPETVNVALRSSTQEAKTTTSSQDTAQVKIPDAIKKYFRLTHTKGPIVTVPPSVLSAEYFDNGEGHGAARVTYPGNYVLDGEYRTMAVSQSFKGMVNARLINPDRVIDLPNSALKGFVAFGGVDGIVLECIYASTSDSSKGAGDCADNRGNQYTLDF